MNAYLTFALYTVVMMIGVALMFHVQFGLTGMGQFGIAGFWGVGLYGFGVTYLTFDWPYAVAMLFGVLLAALCGFIIGLAIGNLNSDGVLVVTLAFASIISLLLQTEKAWTGGVMGIGSIDFPFKIGPRTDIVWLGIQVVVVALMLLWVIRLHHSPYGRLLIAIGRNEPLARNLGKSAYWTKVVMFTVTSAGMGLLGVLYGAIIHFLTPQKVGVQVALAVMVGLVLGGSRRAWGAVVGILLTLVVFDIVVELYTPIPLSLEEAIPVFKQMALGLLLMVFLLFRPLGILGRMRRDKMVRSVDHV